MSKPDPRRSSGHPKHCTSSVATKRTSAAGEGVEHLRYVMSSQCMTLQEASRDFQRTVDRAPASTSVFSLLSVLDDSRQDCMESIESPLWNRFPLGDCRSAALHYIAWTSTSRITTFPTSHVQRKRQAISPRHLRPQAERVRIRGEEDDVAGTRLDRCEGALFHLGRRRRVSGEHQLP